MQFWEQVVSRWNHHHSLLMRLGTYLITAPASGAIMYMQRKCEADFVYLTEGCGKTLYEINDYTSHSDRYENSERTERPTA